MLAQRAVSLVQRSVLAAEARDGLFGPSKKALRRHRHSRGLAFLASRSSFQKRFHGLCGPLDFSDISFRCVVCTWA